MSKLVKFLKSGKPLKDIFQNKSDNEILSEISEDNFEAFNYAAEIGDREMIEYFIKISARISKDATVEMLKSRKFFAIKMVMVSPPTETTKRIVEEIFNLVSDETVKAKYPTLMEDLSKEVSAAQSEKAAADERLLEESSNLSKQTYEEYQKIFLALNDEPLDISKAIELFGSWQDLVQKKRTMPGYSDYDPLSYQPSGYELNNYISDDGNDKINLFSAALKSRSLEFYRHLLKASPKTAKYAEMSAEELELYAYATNNQETQLNNRNEEKIICTLLALNGNSEALLHLIDKAIASKNASLRKSAITAYQIATNNIDQTTDHYSHFIGSNKLDWYASASLVERFPSPLFLMKLARVYSRIHEISEGKDVSHESIQIEMIESHLEKNGLGGFRFDFLNRNKLHQIAIELLPQILSEKTDGFGEILKNHIDKKYHDNINNKAVSIDHDCAKLKEYLSTAEVHKLKTDELFSKTDELFALIVLDLEKSKEPGKEPAFDMQYRFKESKDEGINVLVNKILREEGIIGARLPQQSVKPEETSKLDESKQEQGGERDSSYNR